MKQLHRKILDFIKVDKDRSEVGAFFFELFAFGYKQSLSCAFPVFIFAMLALSKLIDSSIIPRYDFLLITCIAAQIILLVSGVESKREVLVISVFHVIGFVLELHKVNVGSWSYPEYAYSKFAGVPLYSGFMYSSVASFVCRSWDNLDLEIINWPRKTFTILIGTATYLNFFTNAYIQDLRWFIIVAIIIIFRKTQVEFNSNGTLRKMPLLVSFVLIGFFIWLGENIVTLFGGWEYAYQHNGWQMVSFHKLTSWSLLIIVTIIIVAQLKLLRPLVDKVKGTK